MLDSQLGRIAVCRRADVRGSLEHGRLHLRAHFYDDGSSGNYNNWLACSGTFGSGAVGVKEHNNCYAFVHGQCPASLRDQVDWQSSAVPRTEGWHLFELIWESSLLTVSIDYEPVSTS